MKPKHIRWFFIGLLGLLLFVSIVLPEPRTLGISAAWTNGNYRFAGGTEPGALAFAALFIVFYLALMHAAPPELGEPLPGVLRRFFAFWLDFIIAMIAAGPILGILATVVEWRRTGVFEWFFERETPAPGDMLLASAGALLAFVALLFYFAIPLTRGKPSPGACITGYQIISDAGECLTLRKAIFRTILGFVAMSMWPLTPFIARQRKKGKVWFDKPFSTHAVIMR